MTLEQYLIDVGIRAFEYESEIDNEKRELLKDNVEYFKTCYEQGMSAYKAYLFFDDYLNEIETPDHSIGGKPIATTPIRMKALFIRSFKTLRSDGHSVRTTYSLTESGEVVVIRRIVSNVLSTGFEPIRNFGKYIYQQESMVFKLGSFLTIINSVTQNIDKLDPSKITAINQVDHEPNTEYIVELTVD